MTAQINICSDEEGKVVYSRYITKNGVRQYHPTGGVYRFVVKS